MDAVLGIEEVRTALWTCNGNISKAADLLKTTSLRLRNFVADSVKLSREADEARQRRADRAEEIVDEALDDEQDKSRQDTMARFVLKAPNARERGYGGSANGGVSINAPGGTFNIMWADGQRIVGETSETVEGEYDERPDGQ